MNLIQIQEHLKDLPIDVVKSYANAQNPEVPPYMALGELERRSRAEKRKTEMPTQSVKEKLEAEVGAPQAMPQGMPQGGVQMPQEAPQGIAQLAQGMPQGMPQGVPQAVPAMAGGGVAELPVRDDMFNYAPGGIVAFGGGGEADEETAGEAEARAGMETQGPPASAMPQAGLASLTGPATAALAKAIRGDTDEPMPKDPEAIRQAILEKNPELAKLVSTIPGSTLSALSAKLAAQNEASKAQFQENQKRMGLGALGDALIAAGEATRGQKGIGAAFAGFGKSYSNYTAEDIKRQQAQQALERQQMIEVGKLDADIETLKQAYAKAQIEGRVADAVAYEKAIADRLARKQTLQIGAAEKAITSANTEMQTKGTLAHYAATEKNEALRLQQLINSHADQMSIERQRLKMQEASNARTAAHQTIIEDIAKSTKLTADDKANGIVLNRIEKDGGYQSLAKSLLDKENPIAIGSPEYYNVLDKMNDIAVRYYKQYPGLKSPEYVSREPMTATNPQTGEKQISYDGGRTWESTGNVTRGTQPGGNINYVPGRR